MHIPLVYASAYIMYIVIMLIIGNYDVSELVITEPGKIRRYHDLVSMCCDAAISEQSVIS